MTLSLLTKATDPLAMLLFRSGTGGRMGAALSASKEALMEEGTRGWRQTRRTGTQADM